MRGFVDRYEDVGAEVFLITLRSRHCGEVRHLTYEKERTVQRNFCDKRTVQLKMAFALWSRAAVKQLIERKFSLKLLVRGVGSYLSQALGIKSAETDQARLLTTTSRGGKK